MKKIYTLSLLLALGFSANSQVVISQVYGGGGNAGATYTNDFIELFNRGTVAQNLAGWSIQYASAAGPTGATTPNWITTILPNFNLQPGQYFLIQQAPGTTPSAALPTPDLNGIGPGTTNSDGTALATGIAMSGSNGKVILVNVATQQTGINPTGTQIVDKVGYGTTPTGFEGTGPTGTALTSSTAANRKSAGCTDTDSNPSDFVSSVPSARNSSSAINVCPPLSIQQNSISGLKVYPNPAKNNLFISSDSNEIKQVEIYNVLGKVVLNTKVTNAPINISTVSAGVYVVKITEAGKTATRKLVIE